MIERVCLQVICKKKKSPGSDKGEVKYSFSRPLSAHYTFSVSVFSCIVEEPSAPDGQFIYMRNCGVKGSKRV